MCIALPATALGALARVHGAELVCSSLLKDMMAADLPAPHLAAGDPGARHGTAAADGLCTAFDAAAVARAGDTRAATGHRTAAHRGDPAGLRTGGAGHGRADPLGHGRCGAGAVVRAWVWHCAAAVLALAGLGAGARCGAPAWQGWEWPGDMASPTSRAVARRASCRSWRWAWACPRCCCSTILRGDLIDDWRARVPARLRRIISS